MIVTAANAPLARSLAASIAVGDSGKGMWTTGLSASGTGTPTHYVSAGLIWPEFAAMLNDPAAIVAASGGQVTLAQAQALLSSSTIVAPAAGQEPKPLDVIAAAGLKIISEAA